MLRSVHLSSPVGSVDINYDPIEGAEVQDVQQSPGVDRVELDTKTGRVLIHQFVSPGDRFVVALKGAGPAEVFEVAVKCFVGPPPPEYRACPECGVVSIRSNAQKEFDTNIEVFQGRKQLFQAKLPAVELVISDQAQRKQLVSLGIRSPAIGIEGYKIAAQKHIEVARSAEVARLLEQ